MGSFLKKTLILRRVKNISQQFITDELNGLRELGDVMQRILPPVMVNQQKHYAQCENSNSITINMPPVKLNVHFNKFQKLLKFSPHPTNGTNGDDKSPPSDERAQRDEEVRKLQNLRQREIDHRFHQESVWRALKERDEILGRKEDKDTKNGSDNNDK